MSDPDDPPTVPLPVRLAGWVWLAYSAGWTLLLTGLLIPVTVEGRDSLLACCLAPLSVSIWGMTLGIGAIRGTARDIYPRAVYSVMLGGVHVLLAAAVVALPLWEGHFKIGHAIVPGVLFPPGVVLIAAGVLASRACNDYLDWRADREPPSPSNDERLREK